MKSLVRGLLVVLAMFTFAASVNAETTATHEYDNISYNYGDNTFSITSGTVNSSTELTVMLIKGDYESKSLSGLTPDEVYYIGQAEGASYAEIFKNIGMRYDFGAIEPGVYTLVTGGYNASVNKTKVVIGNALNEDGSNGSFVPAGLISNSDGLEYGTITQSFRVYEPEAEDVYIYVGVGNFETTSGKALNKLGFVLQTSENGTISKAYQSLKDLGLSGVGSFSGTLEVGIQINEISTGTDVVVIPYIDSEN